MKTFVFGIRVSKELKEKLTNADKALVVKILEETLSVKTCPTCGQKIKKP